MKVALVCIAKEEDDYIQEWINYHLKLGFDNIFIYQNNWRLNLDFENVIKIEFDGENRQEPSYNHFRVNYKDEYDWAAFFDVDEFLVLKKHKDIKSFIGDYLEHNSIGVNWVLFGDNGLESVGDEYSVIKRFTKRQININPHIKSIVKLNNVKLIGVHNPNGFWVSTDKKLYSGPFNKEGKDDIAQLNHYFCKTKEEFKNKILRGRADTDKKVSLRTMSDFEPHNFNEIEDLTAYNFFYNDNNNILNT